MGTLSDFDLERIIADFGCRYLVETGTGSGVDVEYAATFAFDHVYSIEPIQKLAIATAFRSARNQKMTIIHSPPERGLKMALEEIPATAPVLFWIDDHSLFDPITPISPLERQLRAVTGLRNVARDIFLIDDLRRYEDGAYDEAPCPPEQLAPPPYRDLGFIDGIIGASHRISRLSQRTGYLCAFPSV